MAVRTIAVWCPDWPVVAASAVERIPPQRPVAVFAANRVMACSAAARADGVRRGLRKREAQARCPELAMFDHDPDRDARAFEPVVCAVEAMAPGVEVVRPGLVMVEARGPVSYFGTELAVAERIIDLVAAEAGVECQVGIADGIFAATLAAHRGVLVDCGQTPAFLAPLEVTELLQLTGTTGPRHGNDAAAARRRKELVSLLRRLGLHTLGAFAALPVRDVASRFGPDAVLAHRLASGIDERPLAKRRIPVDLTVVRRLDPPVERVDAAAFAAREPAAKLHELLADRGLACIRLEVHAETEHGEELTRTWRCAEPLTPRGINDRVRWQLDAWITTRHRVNPVIQPDASHGRTERRVQRDASAGPSGGIVLLRLVPHEVVPIGTLRGLWGEAGEGDERAHRAMVRVQGMLGPHSVFTAVLGGGRDPGQQVRLVPWGDERAPERPADQPWPGRLPAPSPATVLTALAHPLPRAIVFDHAGGPVGVTARAVLTAAPHRIAVDGQPQRAVLGWAGPWPVEERWWDPDGGRRRARLQVVLGAADSPTVDGPNATVIPIAGRRPTAGRPLIAAASSDAAAEDGQTALLLTCENGQWRVEGVYD
jgi:protein ImuB